MAWPGGCFDGLIDELLGQIPPVDFHAPVSFPLLVLVICQLLGVPFDDPIRRTFPGTLPNSSR